MTDFDLPISRQIWAQKYKLPGVDDDLAATFRRVAHALATSEEAEQRFFDVMNSLEFLPGGRILSGAGTGREVTLFNCFVMGTVSDSMPGILKALSESAITMQRGGGIGVDFSTIRPRGAPVKGVDADASGPVSFMLMWDSMCRTIMSAGARRGAMMGTLRCDHPDIVEFIRAKRDSGTLRMFNLSVLITDEFINAVKNEMPWTLQFGGTVYKQLPARELWNTIMQSAYAYAEPGVIFIDRVNELNPLCEVETIAATNPCGEQPLPPYGACLLGSINLAKFVRDPFGGQARVDLNRLDAVARTATRLLNGVIDASVYPLEAQAEEAREKRRMGLGVMGLADMLIMLGVRYGTDAACAETARVMSTIAAAAYSESARIAAEAGKRCVYSDCVARVFVHKLPQSVQREIAEYGLTNTHLTSIAPTGTLALLAGNVSGGIEPVFDFEYIRRVRNADETTREEVVSDYAYRLFREMFGNVELPDYFVRATDLTPDAHLKIQKAAQYWVDSAISKTVNCPEDMPYEAFSDMYLKAHELGLKGCTAYRPNPTTGAVLVSKDTAPAATPGIAAHPDLASRGAVLTGKTYKLHWAESPHALYVTINDLDGAPFEIFINTKNPEHHAWVVALTRMISAVFRRGGDVSFVPAELREVFDPQGGQWLDGRYVPSLIAAIGDIISAHMGAKAPTSGTGPKCPSCNSTNTELGQGCLTCRDCGYSKCN